jgi:hypothetical protein
MFRLLVVLSLLSAPAFADDAPAPESARAQEQVSAQAWGARNPDCAEWSDACIVCTKAGCSTPGIACTPAETVCRR